MTSPVAGVLQWEHLVARRRRWPPHHPAPGPDDTALLQYTGGTTGTPKGAVLTHRNLRANAAQGRAWMPGLRDGEETVYAVLPLFHAYGLTLCLTFSMSIGATLVLFPASTWSRCWRRSRAGRRPSCRRCRRSTSGSPPPPASAADLTSAPLLALGRDGAAAGDRRTLGVGDRRPARRGVRHDRDLPGGAGQPGRPRAASRHRRCPLPLHRHPHRRPGGPDPRPRSRRGR